MAEIGEPAEPDRGAVWSIEASRPLVKRWTPSGWRVAVLQRVQWLQAQIDARPEHPVPAIVAEKMAFALEIAQLRSTPATWYSGSSIELVWRELHIAEVEVIRTAPEDYLTGALPGILVRATAVLGKDDLRVVALSGAGPVGDPASRSLIADVLTSMFGNSADSHTAVRSVRNRLILFGLLLLALNLVVAVLSSRTASLLPLCGADSGVTVCPTRDAPPVSGGDVLWLQLIGALGGAVGIVTLLHRTDPSVAPYTLTPHQAVIKILLGAVFAMVGVLVLNAKVIDFQISGRPELLLFALVLGYSQQAGTRLLDTYANNVVQKAQPRAEGR